MRARAGGRGVGTVVLLATAMAALTPLVADDSECPLGAGLPWQNADVTYTPVENGARVREDGDTFSFFEANGGSVTGFREAIESGEAVFLYVYWPRGGLTLTQEEYKDIPCRDTYNLERQCMKDGSVQAEMKKFTLIRINGQDMNKDAFRVLNVKSIPTFFVFNSKGVLMHKQTNVKMNVKSFLELIRTLVGKCELASK